VVELNYKAGTLTIRGWSPPPQAGALGLKEDPREACLRAPASAYPTIVRYLVRNKIAYTDNARNYETLTFGAGIRREPRPFQKEALTAWRQAGGRGVVVLPTGAGKTEVALMAIDDRRRSTLVVAPTLDLVRQWYDRLRTRFGVPVGVVGGGDHDVQPLTVTTYDSAHLHMEALGARFGFLVFDECHHLPGQSYTLAARLSLAPYRLGLTATPERADGRDALMDELIGPIAYRKDITELSGTYLADYQTQRIVIDLSPAERAAYDEARATYVGFIKTQGINMAAADGWSQFIMRAARSAEGQAALAAYRRQRELAFTAPAKLDYLDQLLDVHRKDKTLIFTQDNRTCYAVATRFLIPAMTHHTRIKERSRILGGLADGTFSAIATSKVLNEGVDIPEASVAVVVSGSGSIREHVQRLGRILRRSADKQAVLYELVTGGTSEANTSSRRREHAAYR